MNYRIKKISDDRGVVSLLICMIMIVVITLIAVGFTQLSDNEQNSALNSQLSQEAYYAADSGINYATSVIKADYPNVPSQPTSCTGPYSSASILSSTDNVSYPCVTVNTTPSQLNYNIDVGTTRSIPVIPSSGNVSTINFQWSEKSGGGVYSGCPSGGNLPPSTTSCDASALQIDLVPTSGGDLSNSATSGNDIIYLYPTGSGTTTPSALANSTIYYVNCSGGSLCNFTLDTPNTSDYYMRVLPVYGSETTLYLSVNGNTPLMDAQADIKSTGKAQTVLQSIEATVDISGLNSGTAPFAVQSQESICAEQDGGGSLTAGVRDSACSNIESNN